MVRSFLDVPMPTGGMPVYASRITLIHFIYAPVSFCLGDCVIHQHSEQTLRHMTPVDVCLPTHPPPGVLLPVPPILAVGERTRTGAQDAHFCGSKARRPLHEGVRSRLRGLLACLSLLPELATLLDE